MKKKAFRITAGSVAPPLSFDEVRTKYGATAEDVRFVKLFLFRDSAIAVSKSIGGKASGSLSRRPRSRQAGTRKK
jgi:hypothetical protein